MEEFTEETSEGIIPKRTISRVSGRVEDHELVTFRLNDPENPKNFSKVKKWYCTLVVAFVCFVVAFNSSVITANLEGVSRTFHVSNEVALLTITMFVIGFGVGPLAFAPLSELFGRKPVYVVTLAIAVIFIIPCAVAQNIGTLLVCRLIDGIAFSAPMTLVGGTLADLWRNEERGVPMAFFSAAPFIGPAIGPLVGGYLGTLGWRWLYYIQIILSGVAFSLVTFTVPETYAPALLSRRARAMRKETGDSKYVTEQDLDTRPFGQRLRIFLIRPLQLLFLEPIVFFITLYMSVLYGLLYMFFIAYPIVYQGGKGWTAGSTGLMFIPLALGVVLSATLSPLVNKHYLSLCAKAPNGKPPAEARLIPMMFSCPFIPIGLFIFAFTSYPDVSYWGPMMGGFSVGFGFIFLYNSANNYLVDTYQHQAASALAAKTFLRSIWGAGVVLFTTQMYDTLGLQGASSLLAGLGVLCCAIPFVFYFKGAAIRKFSKFAFADEDEKM
ncbi:putative MFS-type transporter [Cyphellophora attinorum]|uniref:Putative MFS-type transporter n=1 Tax=Cyphellophora attinorum TaxID=1664694 RepID=A0A0N1P0C1_9EURO|nr:putative MFS-type transporter [Phialophora attinorum]KPI43040.1 putative MFS-type transporter [Phialophora attinorum]